MSELIAKPSVTMADVEGNGGAGAGASANPLLNATSSVDSIASASAMMGVTNRNSSESSEPVKRTGERKIGRWIVGETLGEGGFSKVRVGIHDTTGERVALKLLKTDALRLSANIRKQVEAELAALSKLDNPHVTRLIEIDWSAQYTKRNGSTVSVILVVLELVTGGELFEFLSATGCFEEAIARSYFHQLVEGVSYCHEKGVVHRDLKPENLLLDKDFSLKLADFGFAATMRTADALMYTNCGTPTYMAPEMFTRKGYFGPKCDVWAMGVILFIMLAGFPPFHQPSSSDWWFQRLVQGKHSLFWQAHSRNAYFSDSAKDLLNKILCVDPAQRISLEGIKNHEWFNQPIIAEHTLKKELSLRKAKVDESKARRDVEKRQAMMEKEAATAQSIDSVMSSEKGVHRGDDDLPDLIPSIKYFTSNSRSANLASQSATETGAVDVATGVTSLADALRGVSISSSDIAEGGVAAANPSSASSSSASGSSNTSSSSGVTGGGSVQVSFDTFADGDGSESKSSSVYHSPSNAQGAPHISESVIASYTQFTSSLSPMKAHAEVYTFLRGIGAQVETRADDFVLRVHFQTARGVADFAVHIFKNDQDQAVVQFRRRKCDSILFRSLYARFQMGLSHIATA